MDVDWIEEDEKARTKHIEETGQYISYGNFRAKFPEKAPSVGRCAARKKREVNFNAPHQIQLSDEDDIEIARLYEAGLSVYELAERFGVSFTTIINHLEQLGLYERRTRHSWGKREIERVKVMYAQGMTYKEIAEMLRRTPGSVAAKITSLGLAKKT